MHDKITQTLVDGLKPRPTPYQVHDTKLQGFFVRIQPSGAKSFYVEWARGKRKSLGPVAALPAEAARIEAKKILATHYQGDDPRAEDRAAKKAMTFATFVAERYSEHAKTLRTGKETCARLLSVFPDLRNKQLSAITNWDVTKWRAQATKQGRLPASINRNLAILKAALNKAVEWDLIAVNPLARVKMETVDNARVRYLDDAEMTRLFDALDEREERIRSERDSATAWRRARGHEPLPDLRQVEFADYLKPMVILSLHTGARRKELLTMPWEKVDLNGGRITIISQNAKSKRTRHVPLSALALATFKAWQEQTSGAGLVFPNKDGDAFGDVNGAWKEVIERAQIDDFTWHDMRHCFGSTLVQSGVAGCSV